MVRQRFVSPIYKVNRSGRETGVPVVGECLKGTSVLSLGPRVTQSLSSPESEVNDLEVSDITLLLLSLKPQFPLPKPDPKKSVLDTLETSQ